MKVGGQSKLLRILRKREQELRRVFLPAEFHPLGNYSEDVREMARGYSILAHAELEHYLESWANVLADRALKAWKDGRPSQVLVNLVSFTQKERVALTFKRFRSDKPPRNLDIGGLVHTSHKEYCDLVRANNGIKADNFLDLLCRVGLSEVDFDQTWMNDVQSFGEVRGRYAHSSRVGLKVLVDPKVELDRVRQILDGLDPIDLRLMKIRSTLR